MRQVRGDGNCFYRALCFAHLESILHNARALQRSVTVPATRPAADVTLNLRLPCFIGFVFRFKETVIETCKEFSSAGFDEGSFKRHLNTVNDVFSPVTHCLLLH